MKRQETDELKREKGERGEGRGEQLAVDPNAQTGAAEFPRLIESQTRTQAAAEPVSFQSEDRDAMSAAGDACWSTETPDSRKHSELHPEELLRTLLHTAEAGGDEPRQRARSTAGDARQLGPAPQLMELLFFFFLLMERE